MKTSVELNDEKVKQAKSLRPIPTLKELLDKALDAYIAQNKREDMANLLGLDFFEGNLDTLRERKK